jgi:hypothetical protein
MSAYEITILNDAKRPSAIIATVHVSDFAAIRSARKIAGGHALEVWRDLECIYREPATKSDRRHHAG